MHLVESQESYKLDLHQFCAVYTHKKSFQPLSQTRYSWSPYLDPGWPKISKKSTGKANSWVLTITFHPLHDNLPQFSTTYC